MRVMIGFLVVIAMWTGVRPSESYEQRIFLVENTLFQKKIASSLLGISIFSKLTPWNSNEFYSTPLEFSIDILNRGVQIFYWKSLIVQTRHETPH